MVAFGKSDQDVMAGQDDLEMIRRPHLWPHWSVLPMKKPSVLEKNFMDDNGFGVLIRVDRGYGKEYAVFVRNIFSSKEFDLKDATLYPSAEAVLADGWVVD